MQSFKGNAIDYTLAKPKSRVLLHCCNNRGVMGSGIALEVKNRIPDAYQSYKAWCQIHDTCTIGDMRIGRDNDEIVVANLIAQDGYGSGKRFVHYGHLAETLFKAKNIPGKSEYVIPYKMASDRAGGDWNFVIELCKDILGANNITVIEYSKTNEWDNTMCEDCGRMEATVFTCPYDEDINGVETPCSICASCSNDRTRDI